MSDPEPSDEKSIIRGLRYLKQSGMVEYLYKWQDSPNEILVYTDSDWAGCQRTRRSTTGGGRGARTHDKNESRMNLLYARACWRVPTP